MKTKTFSGYVVTWKYKSEMHFEFKRSQAQVKSQIKYLKDQGVDAFSSNKITFKALVK